MGVVDAKTRDEAIAAFQSQMEPPCQSCFGNSAYGVAVTTIHVEKEKK